MFPDLNSMACLGVIGSVIADAGNDFTDDDCLVRPPRKSDAIASFGFDCFLTQEATLKLADLASGGFLASDVARIGRPLQM